MNVKRYTHDRSSYRPSFMDEQSDGDYVLHSDYAALLARHAAPVEAVAWERECCQDIRPLVAWAGLYVLHGEDYVDAVAEALREIQGAARAEVDRLLQEEK